MGIVDLLKPISAGVYGVGVGTRGWAYDRGLLRTVLPSVQTISVGGLEAGGTGKTPVARLVLQALVKAGRRPGLLTRGYRRRSSGLVLRNAGHPIDPAEMGDEAAMIAAEVDVPVATCADRLAGAAALEGVGCDALVLDDGFAHRRIGRHVDIVVLRGESPLGNGHLLPRGLLRETPAALRRAHVVWLHYRQQAEPDLDVPRTMKSLAPDAVWVASTLEPEGPVDLAGQPQSLHGRRVVACGGLARPEDFAATLQAGGAEVVERAFYQDHWDYSAEDVQRVASLRERSEAQTIVVTPKNAIKLRKLVGEDALGNWWVLGYRVRLVSGAPLLAACLGVPEATLTS